MDEDLDRVGRLACHECDRLFDLVSLIEPRDLADRSGGVEGLENPPVARALGGHGVHTRVCKLLRTRPYGTG
jgi:hypothetical protein